MVAAKVPGKVVRKRSKRVPSFSPTPAKVGKTGPSWVYKSEEASPNAVPVSKQGQAPAARREDLPAAARTEPVRPAAAGGWEAGLDWIAAPFEWGVTIAIALLTGAGVRSGQGRK